MLSKPLWDIDDDSTLEPCFRSDSDFWLYVSVIVVATDLEKRQRVYVWILACFKSKGANVELNRRHKQTGVSKIMLGTDKELTKSQLSFAQQTTFKRQSDKKFPHNPRIEYILTTMLKNIYINRGTGESNHVFSSCF